VLEKGVAPLGAAGQVDPGDSNARHRVSSRVRPSADTVCKT
jgi:hypothetical protein